MRMLFITAAQSAKADDIIEQVRLLIQQSSAARRPFLVSAWADEIVAAVARASEWTELIRLDEFWRTLVVEPVQWRFGKVGRVWADVARLEGRASAYAMAARYLPQMATLMALAPYGNTSSNSPSAFERHLIDLASGIVRDIADPELLSDLADLFVAQFGDTARAVAATMSSFALVHRAEDKTKALQQVDPDVATLIRSVLSLPEPKDALSGKGRRKAR